VSSTLTRRPFIWVGKISRTEYFDIFTTDEYDKEGRIDISVQLLSVDYEYRFDEGTDPLFIYENPGVEPIRISK